MKYQKLVIVIKRGEKVIAEFTLTFFWKYETITSIVLLQFIQINIHIYLDCFYLEVKTFLRMQTINYKHI